MEYVSVIVPCRNEADFILNFLRNISTQDYPKRWFECIIIDGNSTDGTYEIISKFLNNNNSNIHLLSNPLKSTPHALNIGIKQSSGRYIILMGIHAVYPTNYISSLIKYLEDDDNVYSVGGVLKTIPANNTNKSLAIAKVTSHIFGVGNSHFRIGAKSVKDVDTVPFGCYRREVFNEIGMFDTDLLRNQDDEFNFRIKKAGKKVLLVPSLQIDYYARDNYSKLSRMFYQYGLFKPLVVKKTGRPSSIRQLVPPVFILYNLVIILSLLNGTVNLIMLLPMLIYFGLNIFFSIMLFLRTNNKRANLIVHLIFGFITIHYSYGAGSIVGYLRILFLKTKGKTSIETNR